MSVIVCRKEPVATPCYVEALGVNLRSSQELCYAIFHHPLFFMDGFVDANLVEFVREQLGMGFMAARMEQRLKAKERSEEILLMFMQECDYYTPSELNGLRQVFAALRKLPPLEYARQKADGMARLKQYGKAIAGYREILEAAARMPDPEIEWRVWNNLGACYARVFRFCQAMEAYEKAYGKKKNRKILENMYHLTLLNPGLELKEEYRSLISAQMKEEWDKEFCRAGEGAGESEGMKRLGKLFEKEPEGRMEEAGKLVERWKQEYRNMA